MQKKLIALAIAGLSGVAFAQSNVTIYGVADATFDSVSATGSGAAATDLASRGRMVSNSSYIGFKGAEDLGGGMKAVFQLENGVNFDNSAAGAWNNRDSYVGLAGGFGTFVMGNVTGPTRLIGAKMDVNSGATGIGANTALLGKIGGGAGASAFDQRITNAFAYISPTVSGFHGAIGYSTGLVNTFAASPALGAVPAGAALSGKEAAAAGATAQGNTAWTLGLVYDQGPIFAAYTYTTVGTTNSGAAAADGLIAGVKGASDNRFALNYSFGMGTAGLIYDKPKFTLGAGGDVHVSTYYIPVTFKVGSGKVIAQYGRANDVNGVANSGASHVVVGYEHNLSKRTTVKALYSAISNKAGANYDFLYGVSAGTTTTTAAGPALGSDPKGFSVGVRHSF